MRLLICQVAFAVANSNVFTPTVTTRGVSRIEIQTGEIKPDGSRVKTRRWREVLHRSATATCWYPRSWGYLLRSVGVRSRGRCRSSSGYLPDRGR